MIVSSGAVAFGRQILHKESLLSKSVRETIRTNRGTSLINNQSCAAVGQAGLMSLYDAMFGQYGVNTAQVLISRRDLDVEHRDALRFVKEYF